MDFANKMFKIQKDTCKLYGKRIYLSALNKNDIDKLRILRNKDKNRKWFIYDKQISAEEQTLWYDHYINKEDDIMFSIFINDEWIGAAALYNIDDIGKKGEFGRLLIDKERVLVEKGLGIDATLMVCYYGFKTLQLDYIELEVFKNNIAAIKTYQHAGFQFLVDAEDDNSEVYKMYLKNDAFWSDMVEKSIMV